MELLFPGIWRVRLGVPEAVTPVALRDVTPAEEALRRLPAAGCPWRGGAIAGQAARRGYQLPSRCAPTSNFMASGCNCSPSISAG